MTVNLIETVPVQTMRYQVTHTTTYTYADSVPVSHNELHLTPRDGRRQQCRSARILVKPSPETIGRRLDYFGNHVHFFCQAAGHKRLKVFSKSLVTLRAAPQYDLNASPRWEEVVASVRQDLVPSRLEALQYVFDSPSILRSDELKSYGVKSFQPGRPVLDGLLDLCQRVYQEFKYDSTATHVHSSVEEVLQLRRGVCQDFAHVMIGVLRSLGLPARYVSGYLRTLPPPGQPRLVGADASHAWLSVFCNDLGWIDIDPTNNTLTNLDHITVAWGRDYSDVCPVKGVFLGGGAHTMSVMVDVLPLAGSTPSASSN